MENTFAKDHRRAPIHSSIISLLVAIANIGKSRNQLCLPFCLAFTDYFEGLNFPCANVTAEKKEFFP
jgi:hypothetical protein